MTLEGHAHPPHRCASATALINFFLGTGRQGLGSCEEFHGAWWGQGGVWASCWVLGDPRGPRPSDHVQPRPAPPLWFLFFVLKAGQGVVGGAGRGGDFPADLSAVGSLVTSAG